jgi:hypothetical protein
LKQLGNFDRSVDYLLQVGSMHKRDQDAFFKDVIDGRKAASHGYIVQLVYDRLKGCTFAVCRSLFMHVLSLGDERMKLVLATRFEPGPNVHNNELNNNAAITPLIWQGVVNYIQDQGNHHCEWYATHVVRVLTKYELRNEEKDIVDLPSCFTKRSMYERCCYENGWKIKADNKGRYPPVTKYAKKEHPRHPLAGFHGNDGGCGVYIVHRVTTPVVNVPDS